MFQKGGGNSDSVGPSIIPSKAILTASLSVEIDSVEIDSVAIDGILERRNYCLPTQTRQGIVITLELAPQRREDPARCS
jgi:hypothetical protein